MLHTLIEDGPKLCMQQRWFPLEPEVKFRRKKLSVLVALLVTLLMC